MVLIEADYYTLNFSEQRLTIMFFHIILTSVLLEYELQISNIITQE